MSKFNVEDKVKFSNRIGIVIATNENNQFEDFKLKKYEYLVDFGSEEDEPLLVQEKDLTGVQP